MNEITYTRQGDYLQLCDFDGRGQEWCGKSPQVPSPQYRCWHSRGRSAWQGDYLLPNLTMPEQPELSMGRYARMRKKFLKEHHKVRYYNLLTSCALNEHLNDTERRANELEQMQTEQMAASEGVTENLKATDMMSWVRKMNSIRSRVQEIVMAEVIFA